MRWPRWHGCSACGARHVLLAGRDRRRAVYGVGRAGCGDETMWLQQCLAASIERSTAYLFSEHAGDLLLADVLAGLI